MHMDGFFHIHDMGTLSTYCVGWDLADLIKTGLTGVPGKVDSRPAKHYRAILGQIVNFMYTLQGEAAGAQAFSDFDVLMAPLVMCGIVFEHAVRAVCFPLGVLAGLVKKNKVKNDLHIH